MSKYILPKGRIPKAFNQEIVDKNGKLLTRVGSCVACTFTKIIEVINFVKSGEYIELSKGYMYGRNNYAGKKNPGMNEEYTLDVMRMRGSVPVKMCDDYDEIPDIVVMLEKRADIRELDKAAEDYKIQSWENISCNNSKERFEKIKEYLHKYEMPLAGTIDSYKGERHSVVIVGYDEDYILFHNHTGEDAVEKVKYNKFLKAYYLDGGVEEMKKIDVEQFKSLINGLNLKRKITRIQLHHTYSPSYSDFTGENHERLQQGMKNYHINTNGWADIGQHFTIFPDGIIMTGRSLESNPAGIYGANVGAICIECLGNFDNGADIMIDAQKNAIVSVVKTLIDKFSLDAKEDVVYHAWYSSDGRALGDYVKSASAKTCPGTNFFGGNSLTAYEKNLLPLLEKNNKEEIAVRETGNDIVWELMNGKHKIEITEVERAIKAIDNAKKDIRYASLYWILYKLANK